jgi:Ca-activated chloride channel homolog
MKTKQFTMHTDQDLIPSATPAQRVIELALQAPQSSGSRASQPLNLALVIDRSGSMSGGKLEYVKQAAEHVLDLLQSQDRAALVAYDDEVILVAPSQPVTLENRREMTRALRALRPGGMTNLSDGWFTGCQEAAGAAQDGMLSRTLLLTDGLANEGITDLEELAQHARQLSVRGISTSTFGVGHGFNEHLLEAMSNQGSGNFYYIETPSDIPSIFRREFQELESVTLRDASISLQIPPQVDVQVLGSWRHACSRGMLRIDLGSLNAGRQLEVYVRVLTPPCASAGELVFQAQLIGKDENGAELVSEAGVVFRYASQAEVAVDPRRMDVLERYASVEMADVATEALKLERMGERRKSSQLVRQNLDANRHAMSPAQASRYEEIADRMEHGLSEADRKAQHANNYNIKRRREP